MELEQRLKSTNKEQLVLLLQELVAHHPVLLTEISTILERLTNTRLVENEIDEEVTEDWDFSGDEVMPLHPVHNAVLLPLDSEACRQRIERYTVRLSQGEPPQSIFDDLTELLEDAETRAGHHDYHGALDLYALVLDERLTERNPTLTLIFDKAIDEVMPVLETLLSEASSNIVFDTSVALSPLLTPALRQRWLERLFALWLKYIEVRHTEENMPELLLNVAWSDDVALLHNLVQTELQQQPWSEHSNIVDFTRQYRTRTLEKFLKELPHA